MKVIIHINEAEDVTHYYVVEGNGKAFGRAYIFNDSKDTIYLDFLSVAEEHRNKGLGLKMQKIREQIGRDNDCKYSFLWVKKKTWMRKWYERRGYKYHSQYKEENAVWLKKKL